MTNHRSSEPDREYAPAAPTTPEAAAAATVTSMNCASVRAGIVRTAEMKVIAHAVCTAQQDKRRARDRRT